MGKLHNFVFWVKCFFKCLCHDLTCVHLSVGSSHHVVELLAALTLAEASRPEAKLLHQHQRLLTKVVFPVPRHPPIRIAHPHCSRPIAAQPSPSTPIGRRLSGKGVYGHFIPYGSNKTGRSYFGFWRTTFQQGAVKVSLCLLIETFNGLETHW